MVQFARFLTLACALVGISSKAHAATLTVNLVNQATGAPVVVPAGRTVTVGCSNASSSWNEDIAIPQGASSASSGTVPNGASIKCELSSLSHPWMPSELGLYDRAGPYTVTVPGSGDPVILAVQLRPTDGSMTVNLVNKDTGAPITVPGTNDEKLSCSSSRYSFEVPIGTNSTSVTMSVFKSEVYTCSVQNLSGYYDGSSFKIVVPSAGSVTRSISLKPVTQSITLSLRDEAGNPFTPTADDDASFECTSSSGSDYYHFSKSSTFNGSATSVTIPVADNRTYKCLGNVIGQNNPLPVTVTVPAGQSVSVPMTVLQPTITASFSFELNGAPLSIPAGGANLICSYSSGEITLERSKNITQGATSTTISLFAGYQYECQLRNIEGYYLGQAIVVAAPVGSTPTHVVDLQQMQATVQVNLVNVAGSAFPAPATWYVNCSVVEESSETGLFNTPISSGQSSMQRAVVGGRNIKCGVDNPSAGYVVQPVRKSISNSGTAVFNLVVYPTDAFVTIRLVDINGVLLTGLLNCSVSARPADGDFSSNLQASAVGGQATIAVPSGIPITTTADCESDGVTGGALSSDGSVYLQPLADLSRTVTIASGATATTDQVFSLPDATIQIILEDEGGARLPGVQMYVSSEATSTGGVYYAGGDTNGDGILSVPVVSQLKWYVHAYAAHDGNGTYTHMGSNEVTVSPAAGQVTDVLFRVKPVTHQLTINITTSDVPSGNGYCMAYDKDGVFEYTPEQPPLSDVRQIPLSSGSWKLVCIGWGAPTGSTQEINLLSEIIDIETPVSGAQFAATVPVRKVSDRISALSAFVQGQGGAVEVPGVRFSVPADAVPIGSASLRVSNAFSSASPSPDRDLGLPFSTFRIDLLDKGNNSIGQFAASELTLFANAQPGQSLIVKELFGSLWRDIGSVKVASAASMTNDSVKGLNSGDASVTATVKRSGVYGVFVTGEAAGKNPVSLGKVSGLRVKFANGVAKMSWKSVAGATGYNVRVHQTLKAKKGTRQKLVRSRQVTATKLDVKGLKRGQYTFTVWAVSASVQGEASSARARN